MTPVKTLTAASSLVALLSTDPLREKINKIQPIAPTALYSAFP
jgi:hypothetical protein